LCYLTITLMTVCGPPRPVLIRDFGCSDWLTLLVTPLNLVLPWPVRCWSYHGLALCDLSFLVFFGVKPYRILELQSTAKDIQVLKIQPNRILVAHSHQKFIIRNFRKVAFWSRVRDDQKVELFN
jgi:hypothetical protein